MIKKEYFSNDEKKASEQEARESNIKKKKMEDKVANLCEKNKDKNSKQTRLVVCLKAV